MYDELQNIVHDVQPINERIITITLNSTIPITFIGTYAPTAAATIEEKIQYYDTLKATYNKHKNKHTTHIAGDFNARVQTKLHEDEACIGAHTFNKEGNNLENQEG